MNIKRAAIAAVGSTLAGALAFNVLLFDTTALYNVDPSGYYVESDDLNLPISSDEVRKDVESFKEGDNLPSGGELPGGTPVDTSGDGDGGSSQTPEPSAPVTPTQPTSDNVLDFTPGGNFECPYTFAYSFMAWQYVENESAQYQWRKSKFPNWVNDPHGIGDPNAFDDEGFGRVDGRYVVAVTHVNDGGIGYAGQALDVYITNKSGQEIILPCVVGDIKCVSNNNWTVWGHKVSETQVATIEFCVDRNVWYEPSPADHRVLDVHPEWAGTITKIVLGDIV